MNTAKGKRAAPRSGERPRPRFTLAALGPVLLATVSLIAWGLLVYIAVGYGEQVRNGESSSWPLLLGTGAAAVACLFLSFVLLARLLTILGNTLHAPAEDEGPRPVGGRRAKR